MTHLSFIAFPYMTRQINNFDVDFFNRFVVTIQKITSWKGRKLN